MTTALSYDEMMQLYPPVGQQDIPVQDTLTPSLPSTMTYEQMAQTVLPPEQAAPLEQPRTEQPTTGITLSPEQQAEVDARVSQGNESLGAMDYILEAPKAYARGHQTAVAETIAGLGAQWELLAGGGPSYEVEPMLDKLAELHDMEAIYGKVLQAEPQSEEGAQFRAKIEQQYADLKNSIGEMERKFDDLGYNKEIKDVYLFRLGQTMGALAESQFAANPELKDDWVVNKIPETLGGFAPMVAVGMGASAVGGPAAGALAVGGMGAVQSGSAGYAQAKELGATESQAREAGRWSTLIGAAIALPFSRILTRVDKMFGGTISNSILRWGIRSLMSAGETGGVMFALTAAENAAARSVYDKNREYLDGAWEATFRGGIAGAIINGLLTALTGYNLPPRLRKKAGEVEPTASRTPIPFGREHAAEFVMTNPQAALEVDFKKPSRSLFDKLFKGVDTTKEQRERFRQYVKDERKGLPAKEPEPIETAPPESAEQRAQSLGEMMFPEAERSQREATVPAGAVGAVGIPVAPKAGGKIELGYWPNEQVARRMESARGLPKTPLLERTKEIARDAYRKLTRAHEFIPTSGPKAAFFASAQEGFRLYRQIPENVAREVQSTVLSLINAMSREQVYLYSDALVVDNMIASRERGEPLRHGFESDAQLAETKARIDRVVAEHPAVAEAIENRKKVVRELAIKLEDAKLLPLGASENAESYYHQQVLLYAAADAGQARPARAMRKRTRAFQKARIKGESLPEEYDYNTHYVEAEIAWMTQARTSLAEQYLWDTFIERPYDVMPRLVQEAKSKNYEIAVDVFNGSGEKDGRRGKEIVQEIERLRAEREEIGAQEEIDSDMRKRLGAISERLNEIDPTAPLRAEMAKGMSMLARELGTEDIPFKDITKIAQDSRLEGTKQQIAANIVLKAVNERQRLIKELAADDYRTWEDFIPEGYEPHQREPGKIFYPATTIPEKVAEALQSSIVEDFKIQIGKEDLRKVLAMGADKPTVVLPEEVVQQLRKGEVRNQARGPVSRAITKAIRAWKVWTLMNPKRFASYNLRNPTGDADAVLGGADGVWKEVPRATEELWRMHKGDLAPSGELRRAANLAMVDSSFTAQEIPDLKRVKQFKRFFEQHNPAREIPLRAAEEYFHFAKEFTKFRENILRYAAYLAYVKQLRAGTLTHFGASRADVIKALKARHGSGVAAAKMARDLLGDYGNVTVFGDWLRTRAIPYWAFQEINIKRYPRMVMNAWHVGDMKGIGGMAGRSMVRMLSISRIAKMYAALWVWNNLVYPEEEERLSTFDQANPHLNLGSNPDGTDRLFRNFGALGEFLEWFGLNTALSLADNYKDGEITGPELLKEMMKDPANKIAQGLGPQKGIAETVIGMEFFPDVFNPRKSDRMETSANILGLRDDYRAARGYFLQNGEIPRPQYAQRLLVGISDPRNAAYGQVIEARERFFQRKGIESGIYPKSKFVIMRRAAEAGNYDAFLKALKVYLDDGNAFKNYSASLKNLDPIGPKMNATDEAEFMDSLSDRQLSKVRMAKEYGQELQETLLEWWFTALEDHPDMFPK